MEIVTGPVVREILDEDRERLVGIVRDTYLAVAADGEASVPFSQFLRFPWNPGSRAISLPAALAGLDRFGVKWVSSFPGNSVVDRPRASAVYVLNSAATGEPVAMLEASAINAARTAASAALAASVLTAPAPGPTSPGPAGDPGRPLSASFIGAGVLAREILDYLAQAGPRLGPITVHDIDPASSARLIRYAADIGLPAAGSSLDEALGRDLVVFATTAARPYLPASTRFRPGQVVLNISLRDIPAQTILDSQNVVDDVEHCLREQTSPHLAEQLSGNRDFIAGPLARFLDAGSSPGRGKPVIFSPFGLGALDLATAAYVYDTAASRGRTIDVPEFFASAGNH
jgi:2,3-diaminopropionate biosynthesis protein SbnB